MDIISIGMGIGVITALSALVSIYPSCTLLKWIQVVVGAVIFILCFVVWEQRKTKKQHFQKFLDVKINGLEEHLLDPNRSLGDLIRWWEENVVRSFEIAFGDETGDAIFDHFEKIRDRYSQNNDKQTAIDKIIHEHLCYLKTFKNNLRPQKFLKEFDYRDLKALEKEKN